MARTAEKAVLESHDVEKPFIEIDGVRHYFKYRGPQDYQCFFGKITVERSVYQANGAGEKSVCPLEFNAGILHHHLTPLAAEFVAYCSASMVPDELEAHCQRWQFLRPSSTTIKLVAAEVGEAAEELPEAYEKEIHKLQGKPPEGTEAVAISRDGVMVNIREEGWRQAQVGSISFYGGERERLQSVYVAQMPEEKSMNFNEKLEREIQRTLDAVPRGCRIACLADGSRGNWVYFENHPDPRISNGVHISDFYHATVYLSSAAEAFFGEGSDESKKWFEKYKDILKTKKNGVNHVIRSIRYFRNRLEIRGKERLKKIKAALRYFTRNQKRMKYSKYLAMGLPIGSGVVEAACKTVVESRLKRSGMRWSIPGGQYILNLRSIILSNRWDSFWKCHKEVLSATRIAA
jgi:hypothetical protein